MGFNVLVRPAVEFHDEMECQRFTSTQQHHQHQEGEGARTTVATANLKLKIPSYDDKDLDESNGSECRTPTSCDQKIPSSPPCPPAPKKPKAIPSCRKRKSCVLTGNILDLSQEIESLFPAPLLIDLYGKINKVRRGNGTPTTTHHE